VQSLPRVDYLVTAQKFDKVQMVPTTSLAREGSYAVSSTPK